MIWAIVIGLLIGIVAKFLIPGRDPSGIVATILIGIIGSALANWIGGQMGYYSPGEGAGFIASVFGAILLLLGYRMVLGRTA